MALVLFFIYSTAVIRKLSVWQAPAQFCQPSTINRQGKASKKWKKSGLLRTSPSEVITLVGDINRKHDNDCREIIFSGGLNPQALLGPSVCVIAMRGRHWSCQKCKTDEPSHPLDETSDTSD